MLRQTSISDPPPQIKNNKKNNERKLYPPFRLQTYKCLGISPEKERNYMCHKKIEITGKKIEKEPAPQLNLKIG